MPFESIKVFSVTYIFDYLVERTLNSDHDILLVDASAITGRKDHPISEAENAFGFIPLIAGTSFIALIAMLVAVPIGLFSGIYMAEYF